MDNNTKEWITDQACKGGEWAVAAVLLEVAGRKPMPLAFSEGQLEQIKTFAYQLPRHLCSQYLHHLAQSVAARLWGCGRMAGRAQGSA